MPQKKVVKKRQKKTKEELYDQKEEDLRGIGYFPEPVLVNELWSEERQTKIVSVFAKGNYSYALEKPEGSKTNQLYSWGFGENYVLGSREDDNQYTPYKVHPRMFEELPVLSLGCGT